MVRSIIWGFRGVCHFWHGIEHMGRCIRNRIFYSWIPYFLLSKKNLHLIQYGVLATATLKRVEEVKHDDDTEKSKRYYYNFIEFYTVEQKLIMARIFGEQLWVDDDKTTQIVYDPDKPEKCYFLQYFEREEILIIKDGGPLR